MILNSFRQQKKCQTLDISRILALFETILFLMYGDGGSRTRVQKLQYFSFYACSLPIYDSRNIMPTNRRPVR